MTTLEQAISKYLPTLRQEGCLATCEVTTEELGKCREGSWSYNEFIAKYPKQCDFEKGKWTIEIETAIDIPDDLEKPIVDAIAGFYAKVRGIKLISTEVKGKKITITFESEGSVLLILALITLIAGFIAITTITIKKAWAPVLGLGALILLGLLMMKKRR